MPPELRRLPRDRQGNPYTSSRVREQGGADHVSQRERALVNACRSGEPQPSAAVSSRAAVKARCASGASRLIDVDLREVEYVASTKGGDGGSRVREPD